MPENGLSINNDYYTFKDGEIWRHHSNNRRNSFYGVDYNSHVDVLFNEESATVKHFTSMKYEGTQSKITQNLGYTDTNGEFYPDNEYYNNIGKDGWYVESGITDLQEAGEMEFKSKEGKWFSYMKGKPVNFPSDLNSKEFSFQGINTLSSIVNNDEGSEGSDVPVYGCTDPTAINYDPLATIDDGSCIMPIYGCTDNAATNYNPLANVDDGSCVYPGPTFQITIKDLDDEDPVPIYGCTNPFATNYNANASIDDGSCTFSSSPGFLTTNTAGGPYIVLTGGGTWFSGADGGSVPTVPYVSTDILFTIKT